MFYVYVYLDKRKPGIFKYSGFSFEYEPIYIGKGHGTRFLDHLAKSKNFNNRSHFYSKIRKMRNENLEPIVLKLYDNLTEEEALKKERDVILSIGRLSNASGPLCNLTDGGDGWSGNKHTDEYKKYLSELHRGDEWRNNIRKALTGVKHSKERIENNRKAQIGLQSGIKNPRAKIYIFISPDGIEYKCEAALKKFAKEHNLNYGLLCALGNGKTKEYKGWVLKEQLFAKDVYKN